MSIVEKSTRCGEASPTVSPVVLVTGAARRIGASISRHLARQGWTVALHCRHSTNDAQALAEELNAAGCRACVFQADLDDEAAVKALGARIVSGLGRWDALVHNASLFEFDDAQSFSYARLEAHMRANTGAAILLSQSLHQHLGESAKLAREGISPCAVFITDQKLENPNPDHLSYTLSKAALRHAVDLLARGLAPRLRVCAVAPGLTLPSGPMDEAEFIQASRMTALGQSSTPEDIAQAIQYLLSAPAVTGVQLLVDGGQHLRCQERDVLFLASPHRLGADHSSSASD